MMETKPVGIYVHIPFCKRKCNYCDFCSVAADDAKIERYINALCSEIKSFSRNKKITVDTVFFGGGTPSILSGEQFSRLMNDIRESFAVLPSAEITAEVNPGTVTEKKARDIVSFGINRISIGMQSIHENEQKILGRIHDYNDFLNTVNAFRAAGIKNLSVDLMYGIPRQTVESFKKTLEKIIEIQPNHISCYGLIIEEGTPFYEMRENLSLPSEDDEYAMYSLAHRMLEAVGYRHYEISNYAKDGCYSRHNLKYWHDEEYIGFGISAHSYYEGKRSYNTSDFDEYFTLDRTKYQKAESEVAKKDSFEYAMLALRLDDGFLLSEYEELFGKSFCEGKEEELQRFQRLGFLKIENGRIFLTHEGFYVSNSILSVLL